MLPSTSAADASKPSSSLFVASTLYLGTVSNHERAAVSAGDIHTPTYRSGDTDEQQRDQLLARLGGPSASFGHDRSEAYARVRLLERLRGVLNAAAARQ